MKTKPKSKTKTKARTTSPKRKTQNYPAYYLAIVLAFALIVEGGLMSSVHPTDWQSAASILDLSGSISQTATALTASVQPMIDMASNINLFYQDAASQMAVLLNAPDMSDSFVTVYSGVADFYNQAADQMLALLTPPASMNIWPASVAGASTIR